MGELRASRCFPKALRLRRSADFARIAQDRSGPHFSRSWIALSALARSPAAPAAASGPAVPVVALPDSQSLRVGFTASRRMAARSVERNRVKRVLREALRHSDLAARARAGSVAMPIDVVLRLRSPLPKAGVQGLAHVKRELRSQADALLRRLAAIAG